MPAAARVQGVHERGQDARPARANRVSERDRAAMNVDLAGIEAELAHDRQRLGSERFVELDEIEIGK